MVSGVPYTAGAGGVAGCWAMTRPAGTQRANRSEAAKLRRRMFTSPTPQRADERRTICGDGGETSPFGVRVQPTSVRLAAATDVLKAALRALHDLDRHIEIDQSRLQQRQRERVLGVDPVAA